MPRGADLLEPEERAILEAHVMGFDEGFLAGLRAGQDNTPGPAGSAAWDDPAALLRRVRTILSARKFLADMDRAAGSDDPGRAANSA